MVSILFKISSPYIWKDFLCIFHSNKLWIELIVFIFPWFKLYARVIGKNFSFVNIDFNFKYDLTTLFQFLLPFPSLLRQQQTKWNTEILEWRTHLVITYIDIYLLIQCILYAFYYYLREDNILRIRLSILWIIKDISKALLGKCST